jgi:hypothetical protein
MPVFMGFLKVISGLTPISDSTSDIPRVWYEDADEQCGNKAGRPGTVAGRERIVMARSSSPEEIAIASLAGGFDRRKQPRFECGGPAEVVAIESGSHYQGEIRDLSLTGCYIATPAKLDLDRRADVELCLCVNGDSLTSAARVIVVRPDSGVAFEFLAVDPEMRAALLTLIQKLTTELTTHETNNAG